MRLPIRLAADVAGRAHRAAEKRELLAERGFRRVVNLQLGNKARLPLQVERVRDQLDDADVVDMVVDVQVGIQDGVDMMRLDRRAGELG